MKDFSENTKTLNRTGIIYGIGPIGDRCIDFFLDAIEVALKDYPRSNHRMSLSIVVSYKSSSREDEAVGCYFFYFGRFWLGAW